MAKQWVELAKGAERRRQLFLAGRSVLQNVLQAHPDNDPNEIYAVIERKHYFTKLGKSAYPPFL